MIASISTARPLAEQEAPANSCCYADFATLAQDGRRSKIGDQSAAPPEIKGFQRVQPSKITGNTIAVTGKHIVENRES
jgi:hypothetical protein